MTDPTSPAADSSWESEIRKVEQQACAAFLQADIAVLERLWAEDYAVNSPLQKVFERKQVIENLRLGRIRHLALDFEIESMKRHGDVVIVMGRDRVIDPPDGVVSHRRYTNIWKRDAEGWRSIGRHAQVVSRESK
jgi:ketosteroid isomerase-like protein